MTKKTEIEILGNKIGSMDGTLQSIKSRYKNNLRSIAKLETELQKACTNYNVSLSSNQCTGSRQTFEEKFKSIVEEYKRLIDN